MNNRGSIILTASFMLLTGFLGFSLLNLTLIHNRTVKARKIYEQRSELIHNKLIYHLHNDKKKIIGTRFKSSLDDFSVYFSQKSYPSVIDGTVRIVKSFSFNSHNFNLFKLIRGKYLIYSTANNKRHKWRSGNTFDIISGDIPINFIPLLVNSKNVNNKIKNSVNGSISPPNKKDISNPEYESVFDTSAHIASILGIDTTSVNISYLTKLLTPEEKKSHLKNGIYMLRRTEKSGPVFVQGNIDKIELSIEDNKQVIELFQNGNYFRIIYTQEFFSYVSGSQCETSGYKFNEKFIINGDVNSIRSKTTPSISPFANPELIILGNARIVSSIIGSKRSGTSNNSSSLTIICSSSPFYPANKYPNIIFEGENPLIIDGSINISGDVINRSKELQINGNIYCENIEDKGKFRVNSNGSLNPISWNNFFIKNFAVLKNFRTDFIEEVFDE